MSVSQACRSYLNILQITAIRHNHLTIFFLLPSNFRQSVHKVESWVLYKLITCTFAHESIWGMFLWRAVRRLPPLCRPGARFAQWPARRCQSSAQTHGLQHLSFLHFRQSRTTFWEYFKNCFMSSGTVQILQENKNWLLVTCNRFLIETLKYVQIH